MGHNDRADDYPENDKVTESQNSPLHPVTLSSHRLCVGLADGLTSRPVFRCLTQRRARFVHFLALGLDRIPELGQGA